jgi:membrane-associated protein
MVDCADMIGNLKNTLHFLFDVKAVIEWGGLAMICAIVFAETGFFALLPGDSLLVTAGVFARAGHLNIAYLALLVPLCAIAGDQVGYVIGRKAGQALYDRPDSFLFKKEHLKRTHDFYARYGAKTIVIGRFVPIVRTFAPIVAGVGGMDYPTFLTYNVAGGALWVESMIFTGFALALAVPDIDKNIEKVILVVIFLSLLPGVFEFLRERKRARA